MDVTRVAADGLARGWRDGWELYATVEDEECGGNADREGGRGAEASTDGEAGATYEVEGWPVT